MTALALRRGTIAQTTLRWWPGESPMRAPTEISDNREDADNRSDRARPTRKRDHVVARLRTLAKYGAGWDGDRAEPPTREAIDDAIDLVANLTMDVPFVPVPETQGAIELIVQGRDSKVILVVEGNRKVSVFANLNQDNASCEDFDIPMYIGAGKMLERALKALL
jgi:hypothetical protein